MQAGYPDSKDKQGIPQAVVTIGVPTITDQEKTNIPWASNPFFSHCIIDSATSESGTDGQKDKTALPVSQQLSRAVTKEQALEILQSKSHCSKLAQNMQKCVYTYIIGNSMFLGEVAGDLADIRPGNRPRRRSD